MKTYAVKLKKKEKDALEIIMDRAFMSHKNKYLINLEKTHLEALQTLGFKLKEVDNKIKIGDEVELLVRIKDAYGEVWHDKGDKLKVKYLAKDGKGVMFDSDLGTHFKNVRKIQNGTAH